MRNLLKGDYFYYVAIMLSVSLFLPVIDNNFRYDIIFSYHPWAILWLISILVKFPKVFNDKVMQLLIIYGVFIFMANKTIWHNLDFWNRRLLYSEYFQIFSAASVFIYFKYKKDYFSLARVAFLSVVFLLITAILSIISSEISPSYARDMTAGDYSNIVNLNLVSRLGGGNYYTAIAFMSIFPVMIYYYRNNNISPFSKVAIIIIDITLFFALVRMQIFGNIIIAVIFTILALLQTTSPQKSVIYLVLFVAIIFILPSKFYSNRITFLNKQLDKETDLSHKLSDLGTFVESGSVNKVKSIEARKIRFPELLDTFAKGPLLGCYFYSSPSFNGYNAGGGHLYWMNKLTVTGLLAFILYITIFFIFIRRNFEAINSGFKIYYLLASMAILSYGLIKSLVGTDAWFMIFVVLPGLYYVPLLKAKPKNLINPQYSRT